MTHQSHDQKRIDGEPGRERRSSRLLTMNKTRGASLLLGIVAVAVLALGGFAAARPASAALNSTGIAPVPQTFSSGTTGLTESSLNQGDADCNDSVNSVDALLALRFAAGLKVNQNDGCPAIETALILSGVFGDVDCSSVVNSVDALKILRFGAGLPVAQNEPPSCVDLGQSLVQTVDAGISGDVLEVIGTNDDDKLILRQNAADANILDIDVGDDGTADLTFDRNLFTAIEVKARNGNDLIRTDEANGIVFTSEEGTSMSGGNGNDTILGGAGPEAFDGGSGDDLIDGNRGNDVAFMGAGNDTFTWDPGDGSDIVEGEDGSDTLLFNGAAIGGAANETVELSANGERFIFFREPGSITMNMNDIETSVFNALGGHDLIAVNDLTGTDVTQVDLNLENPLGSGLGDGQADQVIVNGTAFNDVISVTGSAGNVNVTGLAAGVAISHAEAANDILTVSALGLNDGIDASGLQADAIKQLKVDGGAGEDFILGSHGADELTGGDGHDFIDGNQAVDTALLDAGNDIFRWDPGDGSDVVEGGDGSDTLLFNGAAGGETVELSPNGERFKFSRQPGNITMDTNDVEISQFNAFGGPDTITVNDLTGTDVTKLFVNLAAGPENNASDGLQDQVTVNGTAGNDAVDVTGSAGNVNVTGVAADVAITLADPIDRLDINTLAGNDTVDTSGLAAGVIQLFVDGVAQ